MYALYQLRRVYWRLFRPTTLGCCALVVKENQVLLVRMTYCKGWMLPGGGVDRGETFHHAAVRELREECGIEAKDPKLQGVYLNLKHGNLNHIALYTVHSYSGEVRAGDPREIAEARFFHFDELPHDLWSGHRRRIEEYLGKRPLQDKW